MHGGKGSDQTSQGLLDTYSAPTLISGDLKQQYGPPGRLGAYGSQVISVILVQVHLTVLWV